MPELSCYCAIKLPPDRVRPPLCRAAAAVIVNMGGGNRRARLLGHEWAINGDLYFFCRYEVVVNLNGLLSDVFLCVAFFVQNKND